jgi:hypothetical protein
MSRFEGAPKQMDARYIFPGAKSMIVLGSASRAARCAGSRRERFSALTPRWGTPR